MAQRYYLILLLGLIVLSGVVSTREAVNSLVGKKHISGMVVPHHDLVRSQRADFFHDTAGAIVQPPETIILVSPNHFEA